MKVERWQQVDELLDAALERDASERVQYQEAGDIRERDVQDSHTSGNHQTESPDHQVGQQVVAELVTQYGHPVGCGQQERTDGEVGGIPEMVIENETGFLVQPSDAVAMADAIEKIVGAPSVARRLGQSGYERARTLFAIDKNVRELCALLS